MSIGFRRPLSLLIFSLSLVTSALGQSQSIANSNVSAEVKDFAAALVSLKSEPEQEQLLAQKEQLRNASLLVALKAMVEPIVQKGDYNEALRISHLSVRIAEKIGDRTLLATALCDVGDIYGRRNPPKDAVTYLQKCLTIFEETGDKKGQAQAVHSIAVAYDTERKHELAVQHYEKSLALSQEAGDRKLTALIFNGLGMAHTSLGHYEVGLDFYFKARALSEELGDKGTLNMALNNIGTRYLAQGRYAEALDYLHKSLGVIQEMGVSGDRRSLAYKYQNIGLVYRRQGHLDQALSYSRKSLDILVEIDDKFGIANLQNNVGVIYKSLGQYDEGLAYFHKAFSGYEALKATPGMARALNNIGDTYRLQGRYDEALEPLMKSLRLREQGKDRGAVALSLNNLARLYEVQGKYAEMLEVSQRSAKIADELYSREEIWTAQDHIGRALVGLGKPAEARNSFLASIAGIEALRREVAGGEQQQQSFLENRLSPWFGMIDVLVSQQKYSEALTFAEQSKARVLLDALQTGRVNPRASWSKEEREAEERQRQKLVGLNSQLTNESRRDKPDAARVAELKNAVEKARLEYEDFETKLYVTRPELRLQRGDAPIVKAEELASFVQDASSALLEYVVDEDKTFLFVVTRGDLRVYPLQLKRDELAKQTETYRKQLAARDLGFRASAMKLYASLLKPAEAQLRGRTNLIIVPDNILWDLPFQTLVNGANRFLIEDAAISYAPSLTVLREMTKRRRVDAAHASPPTLLALGNPQVGSETLKRAGLTLRDGKLDPLPEAEEEVKALGRLYGATRSKVYIGAEAREDRVKGEASRAKILHFATHGILNNASPMYSHLALADGGAGEDGLLEAWELMQLDLHADLAVLSACETARGRFGAGEGMVGLSWAMFMAGVPSIVVSQWKVESAGTRDLMVSFHRGLISSNFRKSDAMRQASLKIMKNPQTSHPFYWGGFVIVGDGR
ncbi:MAG TPA: CHAT domain-containing protein [Pyrinomonadaceae bacterium]|nr:CHAT domain-containing protein [Pyrinomonadaceae bacterium]